MSTKNFTYFFSFILLASCGADKATDPKTASVSPVVYSNKLNDLITPKFIKSNSEYDLSKVYINEYDGSKFYTVEKDLSQTFIGETKDNFLYGEEALSFIIKGGHYKTTYTYDPIYEEYESETVTITDAAPVYPDHSKKQMDSYQAGSFSAASFIIDAHEHAKSYLDLAPVMLNMFPIWENIYIKEIDGKLDKSARFSSSNAFYSSRESGSYITFLPMDKKYQKTRSSKYGFHENNFIATHEYGHHVFATIKDDASDYESKLVNNISNQQIPFFKDDYSRNHLGKRNFKNFTKKAETYSGFPIPSSSFNEAFADSFSSYFLNERSGLNLLECMNIIRNHNVAEFPSKVKKVYSKEFIQLVLQKKTDKVKSCEIWYDDPHHEGAVINYITHNLFLKIDQINEVSNDKSKQLIEFYTYFLNNSYPIDNLYNLSEFKFAYKEYLYKKVYEKFEDYDEYLLLEKELIDEYFPALAALD